MEVEVMEARLIRAAELNGEMDDDDSGMITWFKVLIIECILSNVLVNNRENYFPGGLIHNSNFLLPSLLSIEWHEGCI